MISRLGQSAIVLDAPGDLSLEVQRRIWALARAARGWPHVREAVPGMNNLTLIFDWKHEDAQALSSRLREAWDSRLSLDFARYARSARDDKKNPRGNAPIEIPVRYGGEDGPDLALVARHAGLSEEQVIERHAAIEYVVYFLGFKPGFAYLGGLDPRLATPRRKEPRARIAAGSVGIGGEQTGVYAVQSPGGWQLIGRTTLELFNPQRDTAALLSPGDIVRFVRTS
ncbi:MAG TPA: 5-oxoprolinase subunit PxpB [Candidatus Tyrphobacter sp.]